MPVRTYQEMLDALEAVSERHRELSDKGIADEKSKKADEKKKKAEGISTFQTRALRREAAAESKKASMREAATARGGLPAVEDVIDPDSRDIAMAPGGFSTTPEGDAIETEVGARRRELKEAEIEKFARDNSIPRNLLAGALETGGDIASFAAFAIPPLPPELEAKVDRVEIMGDINEGFRRGFTEKYIAGRPSTTAGILARVAGEESTAFLPGAKMAQKGAAANRALRLAGGPGPRQLRLSGRGGSLLAPESTGRALALEGASSIGAFGARGVYQVYTPEEERSMMEAAVSAGGAASPFAAGLGVRTGAGGFRIVRNLFDLGAKEKVPHVDPQGKIIYVERGKDALDEASLALREGAGIGPGERQLTTSRALARLEAAERIDAEGIPTSFGSAIDTGAARDFDSRMASRSPTYASYVEDMEMTGRHGVQEKIAALGPHSGVDARTASLAAAGAIVDQSIDAVVRQVDGMDIKNPVARQREFHRQLNELWESQQLKVNQKWDDLDVAAALHADTLEMPGKRHAFPRVAILADELDHQNILTGGVSHPDAKLYGAIRRRILGETDDATGTVAELGTDMQEISGINPEILMRAQRAEEAAGLSDLADNVPPPGNAETVISFRKYLGELIDGESGPKGNRMLKRRYSRLKSALDEDMKAWAVAHPETTLAQQISDTNAYTATVYERFKDGATGHVLGHRGSTPGDYDSLAFYTRNPGRMDEFQAKFPEFAGDMTEHLVVEAWNATADEATGIPHPRALSAYLKRKANILNTRLGRKAKAKLGNIDALTKSADELGIRKPRSREAVNRGALAAYMDDPEGALDSIYRQAADPGAAAQRLIDSMPTQEAKDGLKDFYWGMMSRRLTKSQKGSLGTGPGLPGDQTRIPTTDAGDLVTWLGDIKNVQIAKALMGENHLKQIEQIAIRIDLVDNLPTDFHTRSPKDRWSFLKIFAGSGTLSVIQRKLLRGIRIARMIDRLASIATDEEAHAILALAMTDKHLGRLLLTRYTREEARVVLKRFTATQRSIAPRVFSQLEAELGAENREREKNKTFKLPPAPASSAVGLD
jgi:hypothetical protein